MLGMFHKEKKGQDGYARVETERSSWRDRLDHHTGVCWALYGVKILCKGKCKVIR